MRKHQKKCHRRISAAVIFLCIGAITLAMIGSSSGTAITLEQSEQQETQETIISHSGSGVSEEKMISVTRSDGTVDTLNLEDYLIGVLSAEVSPQFYEEALKAQAIAARTYTESKLQEGQPFVTITVVVKPITMNPSEENVGMNVSMKMKPVFVRL